MIIESALDQDKYKVSMLQPIFHQFSGAMVEYQFKCRTPGIDFRPYVGDIIKNVNKMCMHVHFTKEDLEYIGDTMDYITLDFLQFLKQYRYEYEFIHITTDDNGNLHIYIIGPWLYTHLFEVPVLSIISEVYSRDISENFEYANMKTMEKADLIQGTGVRIAEGGGRRRHSIEAHYNALEILNSRCPDNLVGTSNIMMAKKLGIKSMGTMAHEWLQAHQALGYPVGDSQKMALENWAKEYRGNLGIALSDVIGLKYFLHDFDMYLAKLFDGTRQDSGDPFEYGNALIHHYASMNIDPRTKSIIFSDGLDFEKALKLYNRFRDRIQTSCLIGTNITNDFDFNPLQIVLKMTKCNGQPVAKISDTPEKSMCNDEGYKDYVISTFDKRIKILSGYNI